MNPAIDIFMIALLVFVACVIMSAILTPPYDDDE